MREIFPGQARLGPADPLPGPIKPSAAGSPEVAELVDALAARYAYPRLPWVRANMISSADGAVAVAGRSGGLAGVADRLVFSVLRSLADVVLVGAGTARAEGYGMPTSGAAWSQLREGRPPAPRIAVVTRRLDLDLCGRLFDGNEDHLARPIVLTTHLAPDDRRGAAARVADVIVAGEETVSAGVAIDALTGMGYDKILAEGGPSLLGQLLTAGLLDELCLTISPLLEGGRAPRLIASAVPTERSSLQVSAEDVTGLKLEMVLEDAGFLLIRYLRTGQALVP